MRLNMIGGHSAEITERSKETKKTKPSHKNRNR